MIIKETYQDMAGNYRYVVEVDNTLAIPLKYTSTVTDAKVLEDAQAVYDRMQEQEEIDGWTPINFDL